MVTEGIVTLSTRDGWGQFLWDKRAFSLPPSVLSGSVVCIFIIVGVPEQTLSLMVYLGW